MELGAGTGFLSILLAQLGAQVIATDLGDDFHTALAGDPDEEAGEGDNKFRCGGEFCRQTPLTRTKYNIRLNGLEGKVRVEALDWMDCTRSEKERPGIWQELHEDRRTASSSTRGTLGSSGGGNMTIIAADVIYDPDLIPPLVSTIAYLLDQLATAARFNPQEQPRGELCERQAIVAATVRNESTLDLFERTCSEFTFIPLLALLSRPVATC